MLPFDPQELEARPPLAAAIPRHRAEPWLPQTPWHLQRDSVEWGPPRSAYLPTRLLGEWQRTEDQAWEREASE